MCPISGLVIYKQEVSGVWKKLLLIALLILNFYTEGVLIGVIIVFRLRHANDSYTYIILKR